MTKDSQDELARAYAMLSALRTNISQMTDDSVEEKYVKEFHSVLDKLDSIEIDVSEFRIADSLVKPKIDAPITVHRDGSKTIHYSEEKYVERSFILTKIDAVLGYFEIITSEKPKKMGFSTPQD